MIEVLVLGPIELRRDVEIVPVPGGKPRALLAALVIDANQPVSQDRLIEALWGESAPARAASNLHVHVALSTHRQWELCRLQHVAIHPVQAQEADGLHQIMVRA